ncbi:hypothetical protein Hanom_Chr04g00306061 [Helianthus anomalus]
MRGISVFLDTFTKIKNNIRNKDSPLLSFSPPKPLIITKKCLNNENGHDLTLKKWMELTSWMKMTRFKTFWIQMRKNKPLDEIRKSSQTSGAKMAFYSINLR